MSEKINFEEIPSSFIDDFVKEDMGPGGRTEGMRVHTRFPPEPNGYLHIGTPRPSILTSGTAERFGGICNLRMDDTNPVKEDVSMWTPSKRISTGWATIGTTGFTMPPTTLKDMYKG